MSEADKLKAAIFVACLKSAMAMSGNMKSLSWFASSSLTSTDSKSSRQKAA
jgi:hypothetical protein